MAARPAPDARVRGLPALLLVTVLLGLAGAILLAPPPASTGVQLLPELTSPAVPAWLGAVLLFAFVGALFFVSIVRRILGEPGLPLALLRMLLAVGLVATAFAVIFHLLSPAVTVGAPENGTAGSNTTPPPPPDCATSVVCTGQGRGAPIVAPWFAGPILYAVIIGAVVVTVLLYARYSRELPGRVPRPSPRDAGVATRELRSALARLGEGADADDGRRRIIRAYGQLLEQVATHLENLGPATPREIEREIVARFGVLPSTAREMTALFEEARYSRDRPLSADAVPRAEAALRRAIEESAGSRRGGT